MAECGGISGFVLAGGRSSRMGRDKALVELAGRPLVAHAVAKLRRVLGNDAAVSILAGEAPGNASLSEFGPVVFDRIAGCGPLGGVEAAVSASDAEWTLIVPVDVPFLPAELLRAWVEAATAGPERWCEVALFAYDGVPQPTLVLLHRTVGAALAEALEGGRYKLYPVLEAAARRAAREGAPEERRRPWVVGLEEPLAGDAARLAEGLSTPERTGQRFWFANLNTPEDLALAQGEAGALATLG